MGYGQLKPDGYIPRIADGQLEQMLAAFGAVEVAGSMWCGKTWTSLAFGQSVTRIGLAGPRVAAEADPGIALLGDQPHVVDEWQDVPAIWDEARAAVDASGNEPGSFILTGSSEPRKGLVHHSGAGRIGKLRMRTMTLAEMGLSSGAVSLARLSSDASSRGSCSSLSRHSRTSSARTGGPRSRGGTSRAPSTSTYTSTCSSA